MTTAATIFVLIASYRDTECQWTIKDLFEKAANPAKIRVGVCWQADLLEDKNCFQIETRPNQVSAVYFRPEESMGVCWARAQAQALLRDEDYALQIDSHMRFVDNWDEHMVNALALCDSANPILTVYPPGYTPPNQLDSEAPPRVQRISHINASGIVFYSAIQPPEGVQPIAPMPTAGLAAGFIFGPSRWLRRLRHDPLIYFHGEEHALAARLWTHGFDLFSPHQTLIYHYYTRSESAKPWSDDTKWHAKHQKTLLRLRQLLTPNTLPERDRTDLGIYGLGSQRSLEDYEAYAGINFSARSIASYAQCFPYVRTADVTTMLGTDHYSLTVSDQAQLFILGDEGLLFSASRGEIYHLNTAATYVWCLLEENANWQRLVTALSTRCDMTAADAEKTLTNLLIHWRGQGVLLGNETADGKSELAPLRDDEPKDSSELNNLSLPGQINFAKEQRYCVLETHFNLQFCDEDHAAWLMPALRHFETNDQRQPNFVLTVYQYDNLHYIFLDGELAHSDKKLSQLGPCIKYQLVRTALDCYDHIMNLHAGVVAKNGALIALPAQSGDGKSTLVAGLVKHGYQYFTDELAPLARGSCKVIPVPLGICVKTTAFSTLETLYPEIPEHPVHDRDDGRRAVYLPPSLDSIASLDSAQQITHLVFPRYRENETTQIIRISQVEAFARAMEHCVSIPKPLTLDDASALVNWIEQVECYDLVSGSLEEAIQQIDALISA
ncbi:Coenzyme PQQ synthesis protein D (PqqD) [Neptunomonas antarctica]|uniref:Coenzyme PQQ synthesis protein D (PqqD) n=2 Tax=Neptunomonas antarctica TaxID=619304 RepID=A0A1N7L2C7_9GAMM|nr:Coenzyme PQQ synthesis protein D (PqqD) [Neptunomonas antarctica]